MTTRRSAETHIRDYLGPAAEFTHDELPTLRSVLRSGLHLQQKQLVANDANRRNHPIKEMASDIIGPPIAQWQRANIQITPPVTVQRYTLREENMDSLADYLGHRAPASIQPYYNSHV